MTKYNLWTRLWGRKAALEEERLNNELCFLKAQFNPHFLFNSINSIYGHIPKDNRTARNMLVVFSEMLRYQLYECNTKSVSFDRELQYIRNYVALQQIRKEEDLQIKLNVDLDSQNFHIAPLLFTAFIENAFRYVSTGSSEDESKVVIWLEKKEQYLQFRVFNTRETSNVGLVTLDHQGIGISNAIRRLELLYPGQHELQIDDGVNFYQVTLKIDLHPNPEKETGLGEPAT
ncbi:MAG: histidine kinase [Bacteroidetes bacterium]|nr:histidine kinase [Bacteroidota bacterium]